MEDLFWFAGHFSEEGSPMSMVGLVTLNQLRGNEVRDWSRRELAGCSEFENGIIAIREQSHGNMLRQALEGGVRIRKCRPIGLGIREKL